MIFQISKTGEHVWLSGFDNTPKSIEHLFTSARQNFPTVSVQVVDLERVPGRRYLTLAIVNAVKSFHSKQAIAHSLSMELLLYVSGVRQINDALRRVGMRADTRKVVAIAVDVSVEQTLAAARMLAESIKQESNDELLDDWSPTRIENVRSGFQIGTRELNAVRRKGEAETVTLERLAVERSAMLAE